MKIWTSALYRIHIRVTSTTGIFTNIDISAPTSSLSSSLLHCVFVLPCYCTVVPTSYLQADKETNMCYSLTHRRCPCRTPPRMDINYIYGANVSYEPIDMEHRRCPRSIPPRTDTVDVPSGASFQAFSGWTPPVPIENVSPSGHRRCLRRGDSMRSSLRANDACSLNHEPPSVRPQVTIVARSFSLIARASAPRSLSMPAMSVYYALRRIRGYGPWDFQVIEPFQHHCHCLYHREHYRTSFIRFLLIIAMGSLIAILLHHSAYILLTLQQGNKYPLPTRYRAVPCKLIADSVSSPESRAAKVRLLHFVRYSNSLQGSLNILRSVLLPDNLHGY